MDFTYDAEQEALRDVARQAMDREVGGARLRQMADDPDGIDADLWTTLVDLGWTGLVIPEAFGGAGGGLSDLSIVLNETGRVPLPGPFFSSGVMATLAAKALGANSLLADLSAGRTRGTVALHDFGHGDPLGTVRTRARRRGATWVLDGVKPLVLDGHTADWAIVVAGTEEGRRAFLVEKPDGEPVPALDPTRKVARLEFHDRPCEPIGPERIRRRSGTGSWTTPRWHWQPKPWGPRIGRWPWPSITPRSGWYSIARWHRFRW